jgi:amino acid transporter
VYFLPLPLFRKLRPITYWAIVGYTLLTIVLWIFLGDKAFNFETTSSIGYFAKIAEMFLLVFMGFDLPIALQSRAQKQS